MQPQGNGADYIAALMAIAQALRSNGYDTPAGSLVLFAGASASIPAGWLLADGTAVSRTAYAALFAQIGTVYGVGDGSTTFNLPNMQGRVPLGVGTATGAAGATAHTLGQTGGEETHALTIAELATHSHNVTTFAAGAGGGGQPLSSNNTGGTSTPATSTTGSGTAHNTLPPYVGLNYIIKT